MHARRALGGGVIVLALAIAGCSDTGGSGTPNPRTLDPFASGSSAASGRSTASDTTLAAIPLQVGQCFDVDGFDAGAALDLSAATVVDCAQPHQHEVFAIPLEPSPPGAAYPGEDNLTAFADEQCLAAFAPYTGVDYRASHFDIASARPSAAAWSGGDRRVICALHDADFAELTAPVKAAPG